MRTFKLYSGAAGLNNKVVPHRLRYDPDSGVVALSHSENVLIDPTGEVVTRKGFSMSWENTCHSLFSRGDWGLIAGDRSAENDTGLYKVTVSNSGDVSTTGIWAGLARGREVDFCDVCGLTFYANGLQKGVIDKECTRQSWTESIWPSDDTHGQFTTPPDNIEHLAYNAGRLYFSIQDGENYLINYTEYGMLGIYDLVRDGEQLPSRILLMATVADGLYVSDENNIYFLAGLNPHNWTCKVVAGYPAKEWGQYQGWVDPSDFGLENNRPSRMVATVNGPLLLMPGGNVVNLIDKVVNMQSACKGASAIGVFNKTLVVQSGGSSSIAVQGAIGGVGNKATTQLTNYGFQSFAVMGGVSLGANGLGLFKLNDGETDNGSEYTRSFTPATTDFGVSNLKRMRKAYFGFSADGDFSFTVAADEQTPVVIPVTVEKAGLQRKRIPLNRNQYGRYWKTEVSSTSAFRFDSIDLLATTRSAGLTGY